MYLKFVVIFLIYFLNYNSLADSLSEEREFVITAKISLLPAVKTMKINVDLEEKNDLTFKLNFDVNTLQLADVFSKINGNGNVNGVKKNIYKPIEYNYDYIRNDKEKKVNIVYLDDKIKKSTVYPEFDKTKLIEINEIDLIDTIDPATFFLNMLYYDLTNNCTQNFKIFDGKRRYNIVFLKKIIKETEIICEAQQIKIGGYKKNKLKNADTGDYIYVKYNKIDYSFREYEAKSGNVIIKIIETS